MRRPALLLAVLALGLAAFAVPSARAQTAGTTVSYAVGWNLISLPAGTNLALGTGDLYHWLTNADSYTTLSSADDAIPALGYWAFVSTPTQVTLAAGDTGAYAITPRAGHFVMIGNPSGTLPAAVSGADEVYTYDPTNGYQTTTILEPGQGAWAISLAGNTITIAPQATLVPVPVTGPLQPAATSNGYTLDLPQGWVSTAARKSYENAHWRSSDGTAEAGVFILTLADGALLNPVDEINGFINGLQTEPESTNIRIVSAPTTITVPGASAAAMATVDSSFDGLARQDTYVVAVHNQTDYVLDVVLSGPYLDQTGLDGSGLVSSIVGSFQITP